MKPIPGADEIPIKPAFKERYAKLTDWEPFLRCSLSFLRRSIRMNTLKISVEECKKRMERDWVLTPIPWCAEGFWVEHKQGRRDIGNTLEHQLGYIYIQEAASMIPPLALDPQPGELVLDMCASPGSKTTQITQMMSGEGLVVANDYQGIRLAPLGINLNRTGAVNSAVTLMKGHRFAKGTMRFDRVLVDAPCSGTGTIRKSLKTLRIWNPNMVRKIAAEQRRLVQAGFDALKEGGTLVYSTCSLEPEEDEAIVDWLVERNVDAEVVPIKLAGLKRGKLAKEFEGKTYCDDVKHCLRLWPQDNDTEGFFIAKIRKR